MTVEVAILLVLTLGVTSVASREGDLLHDVCQEACRDSEQIREQCFKDKCQEKVHKGENWFPCFLNCWNQSRTCLARCADNFWKTYATCSRKCLGRTGKRKRKCRHACAVQKIVADNKKEEKPEIHRIKVKVDKPRSLGYT
ncbi:hypothetical protein ACOMHN_002571 [Nucella lapillus]